MPEGHTIHRAARDHRRAFSGQKLSVTSPQGRFSEGASLLDSEFCETVEAFGKHLLYRFKSSRALHVHLGLFGRLRKQSLPLKPPKGAVRVRLASKKHFVDINGPTICEVLDQSGVNALLNRIGPDVLRADANPEISFQKIRRSNLPIGRLIMDQSIMAGIETSIARKSYGARQFIRRYQARQSHDKPLIAFGQICIPSSYRDEEKCNCHCRRPNSLKKKISEKYNIFGRVSCPKCDGAVRHLEINKRRAFVCDRCQPLPNRIK